jgi:two-component system OmpR family response regulator
VAAKRILFVDNRPEFAHQPVVRLRMEGYEVDEVMSGADALDALRGNPYDLLIFDADLPGADGWDVLKRLRAEHGEPGLKVLVFIAGRGETGKLQLVPVDAELRRPFRMEELVRKVGQLLDEPRRRPDPS